MGRIGPHKTHNLRQSVIAGEGQRGWRDSNWLGLSSEEMAREGLSGNGRGVSEQLLGALGVPEAVHVRHHIRIPALANRGRVSVTSQFSRPAANGS